MKLKQLGFAESRNLTCETDECGITYEGRCILCGGIFQEQCRCGDCGNYNACICGLESTNWQDIRPGHLLGLIVGLAKTTWYAVTNWDFYWFGMAFGLVDV